jgi:hypothetical protein
MKRLSRLVLFGVLMLLAFPLAAQAQTNVKVSGLTHLFNSNRTPATVNSDLAFWGNLAFTADFDGFRVFNITNPAAPTLLATVTCTTEPGLARAGQGDISVFRNLVFRSVDTAQTSPDCATRRRTAAAATTAPPGFEGIDIFDVSNPSAPSEVAHVATDCGSHTHTLVPDLARNRVLLYVSSYPAAYLSATPTAWGNTCQRLTATGAQGHDKLSIVEVPLAAPQTARVIAEPQFNFAGGFQNIPGYRGCHDITVHMTLRIAAGACLTEGVIFDISNPAAPTIKQRLVNPAIDSCARSTPNPPVEPLCLWHSSTFTWDGKYMVFGDEDGGGGTPECSTEDPSTDGAFWLHRVATPTSPIAHFKIPRVQFDRPAGDPLLDETCTAHIMNFVPINGRYIMPSSWYFGGTSVVNWTNVTAPTEMAYFEIDQSTAAGAAPYTDTWTTYWYNDYIHANDINRGYDVLRLEVPWRARAWNLRRFNPQTQEDLATCTVRATGPRLRANRARHVAINVRTRNGVALIGGQAIAQAQVTLRGAGVSRTARTNANGMAHVRVRPTRRGTLRIAVRSDENLLGCRTQRSVAAAAVAPGGGRLTGSR